MNRIVGRIIPYAIALAILLLFGNAWLGLQNTRSIREESLALSRTGDALLGLERTISTMKDAETGERGFIITGEPRYLDPYDAAVKQIDQQIAALEKLVAHDPVQLTRIPELKKAIAARLATLNESIEARKAEGFDPVRAGVTSDQGKAQMDEVRRQVSEMIKNESAMRRDHLRRSAELYRFAFVSGLFSDGLALLVIAAFGLLLHRHLRSRQRAEADIFEQRELFRTTIASIGDGVVTTDMLGRVTSLNGVAQSLTGWSESEARGQLVDKVFKIVHEQTRAQVVNPVGRVLNEGAILGLANHTVLISKDGTERPIDDSAAPIADAHGKTIGVVMIFRDVTERRRAEQALLEANERLRQSELQLRRQAEELENQLIASGRLVSLGEITASMAHEFNNPLGIVAGFAQDLMSESDPNSSQYEAMKIINDETKRCQGIIQSLLQYARPKSAEVGPTDLGKTVEKTLALVSNRLYKQKISAVTDIAANLSQAHADAQQLEQVLVNLYLNAIDAMPDGGTLTVRVGTVPDASGNANLVITVADTGFGIDRADLPKIFLPFFSAKKSKGLGLGLSICDRIIRNHGGRIEVDSELSSGTSFRIHLPLDGAEAR
jgi:PAS domain S-box-containing protein